VFAGWFGLNGNGEMTGTSRLDDCGLLFYPIAITNTNSVGVVRGGRAGRRRSDRERDAGGAHNDGANWYRVPTLPHDALRAVLA
jgi:D-aminopeptidase